MDNNNSVLMTKDYGFISYHFSEVMDAKKITRYALAKKIGARFEVADHLYKGIIEKMDMDILARTCFILDCEISDVIRYHKVGI